ncbi:MAG: tellurite resistance protein [Myxococcota bacterium]|jgi:tellurite resistance protein
MIDKTTVLMSALAQVAWADGQLLPAEAAFFANVLDALELAPGAAAEAWRSIVVPPKRLSELALATLTEADHHQVLKVSYAMAQVDGAVSDEELTAIRQLGDQFGIRWKDSLTLIEHSLAW